MMTFIRKHWHCLFNEIIRLIVTEYRFISSFYIHKTLYDVTYLTFFSQFTVKFI